MSQLRKRNVNLLDENNESDNNSTTERLVRSLKALDVYPKIEEEHAVKTHTGGTISITTLIIISILFLSELWNYFSITTAHSITVDTRTQQQIHINFNVTFPHLNCDSAGLDVMDVSGDQQSEASENFYKQRINSIDRTKIGEKFKDSHDSHDAADKRSNNVNILPPSLAELLNPNLLLERNKEDESKKAITHEGCELSGEIVVNKVAGNLHIALGAQHMGNRHVHQFQMNDMMNFDSSHEINHLSFGPYYPGLENPLDGVSQSISTHVGARSAHFQYFVKIVPVMYANIYNETIESSQYSVTSQTHYISAIDAFRGDNRKIPGLFVVYEISPFLLKITEKSTRLSEFLISLCAILGGVLTIAGIIDSVAHHSTKIMSPKH